MIKSHCKRKGKGNPCTSKGNPEDQNRQQAGKQDWEKDKDCWKSKDEKTPQEILN